MELCKKSGEKLLADIIVVLKDRSASQDARTRTGACLFLAELMSVFTTILLLGCPNHVRRQSTTDTQRESQETSIISIVRSSLVDDKAIVRTAAAKAFDILQEQLGSKAVDQTIPTLLEALRQPGESSETALQALKEVMNVSFRPRTTHWNKLMMGSGPCPHCVPNSHPYPRYKPDDPVQCPCPWVSRGRGGKCPKPKAYHYRRGPCSGTGDHDRWRTSRRHQRNLGDPPRINRRRRRAEHPYAPSLGMVSRGPPPAPQYTYPCSGRNIMTQSAVPARARCSPRSARHPSWTLHYTVSIGSVSSSR